MVKIFDPLNERVSTSKFVDKKSQDDLVKNFVTSIMVSKWCLEDKLMRVNKRYVFVDACLLFITLITFPSICVMTSRILISVCEKSSLTDNVTPHTANDTQDHTIPGINMFLCSD